MKFQENLKYVIMKAWLICAENLSRQMKKRRSLNIILVGSL